MRELNVSEIQSVSGGNYFGAMNGNIVGSIDGNLAALAAPWLFVTPGVIAGSVIVPLPTIGRSLEDSNAGS